MRRDKFMLTVLISAVLSACGGSSGDSTPQPVVEADTAQLKNNAVAAIGGDFDGNISAVGRMFNQNRSVVVGTTGDVVVGGTDEFQQDIETETDVQESIQELVVASLAASEGSAGVTTRTGNTINIDPDETEVCEENLLSSEDQLFGASDPTEFDNCRELVKDLTVQLVASGEESGSVSYLFKNEPVLTLGYAPGSESVELDFGGLRTFTVAYEDIYYGPNSESAEFPAVVTGSIRAATVTTNDTPGQEAGSVSLDIVKPINIVNSNSAGQEELSMAPGTLFAISADVGTGIGSLSFDVGAISAAAIDEDSQLGKLNLAGFTGKADVNPDNGTMVVSNLGLSRGPLSVSIDNQEVLRMTLQSFGFQVSEQSDALTINGDLNLSLFADNSGLNDMAEEDFADGEPNIVSSMISMMAPSGTAFSRAGSGAVQIGGTGPFTVSYGATDDQGAQEESVVVVNAGECVESYLPDEDDIPSAEKCL